MVVTMTRRGQRWPVLLILVAGITIAAAANSPASSSGPGVETVRVPSESMEPTIPVGSWIEADYAAFDTGPSSLGDIVIFNPPRSAEHMREDGTYRCAAPRRARQMCSRPVPRLATVKFLNRVVGLPGDRLRLRRGRLIRNGERVEEPFTDRTHCRDPWADCSFPRQITVPPHHYFLLGDNRGRSHDSRHWGPVPRRALLALIRGCTTDTGERCGDQP
jgi:signal peptidase I